MISYEDSIRNQELGSFIDLFCPKCGAKFSKGVWLTGSVAVGCCVNPDCSYISDESSFLKQRN